MKSLNDKEITQKLIEFRPKFNELIELIKESEETSYVSYISVIRSYIESMSDQEIELTYTLLIISKDNTYLEFGTPETIVKQAYKDAKACIYLDINNKKFIISYIIRKENISKLKKVTGIVESIRN